MPPGSLLRFGAFELDLDTGELRKQGRKIKLAPQPFQVLALLAGSSGRLITRETLREQLWDRDTIVDFEHGLNFCIRQIRSALGESARRPRFIETLPRRGYRFIAPATAGDAAQKSAVISALTRGLADDTSAADTQSNAHTTSIVVLEFENLCSEDGNDWLATGIAETLATDLRSLRSVRVASRDRTRAMMRQIGESGASPSLTGYVSLGRQMGADWVVTGSYQQAGGRLRITPQLIDVGSGEIQSVGKTDGTWDEIFELQDQVANGLIKALKLSADAEEAERIISPETQLLEAYEQYSRGRRGLYQMGKGTLEHAHEHFERALALDPEYAMAHSGLGSTHAMRFIHRTNPKDLIEARTHLERARELDPELAEPYPWLCYLYLRDGKVAQSIQAGLRGVQLLPDLVHAHYFLAIAYFSTCETPPVDYQSAMNHLREAARIDPRWQATWYNLASISLLNGNYARAEEFAKTLLRLNSHEDGALRFIGAEILLGKVELRRGNYAGALRWFAESLSRHSRSAHVYRDLICAFSACGQGDCHLRQNNPDLALTHYRRAWQAVQEAPTMLGQERAAVRALAGMATAYAALSDVQRAGELLSRTLRELPNARLASRMCAEAWLPELLYALAVTHVRTAQVTEALDMLEQALLAGWHDANWLEQDPEMRPLVHEPRFIDLVEQVRQLPPLEVETETPAHS